MSQSSIFYPVFAQAMLTFVVAFIMGVKRIRSLKRGELKIRDIALKQPNWTENVTKVSNNYHNQFEIPVLFFVVTIFSFIAQKSTGVFIGLAWAFVLSRIVHSYIHIGTNHVPTRANAFFVGVIILFVMWVILGAQMIMAGL